METLQVADLTVLSDFLETIVLPDVLDLAHDRCMINRRFDLSL